jgi:hypothetical protein
MTDVRIIDLDLGSVNDNHLFESDDGSTSFKITAIDLRAYCQNGLTPQSIGIAAGVTTTELNFLDGVTAVIQEQIDAKAPINNPTFTGTASGITKAMVGLSNVDNTSDINKPISTLQQTSLDGKVSTSVTINTASGLTGGGSLSTNRTISLDISSLANKAIPSGSDQVLIYDPVSLSHRRTTVSGITSGLSGGGGVTVHSALTGLNADDHPQYSLANGTRWAANQTANRVAISTASGHLSASNISTTQLGYLSDVTSPIQGQINNKTDSGHTHSIANINNLQADLNTRAVTSRVVATASGLTGGGDLSADRTIGLNISGLTAKTTPSILDEVLIYDVSTSSHRRTTVSGITGYSGGGGVTSHNALTGLNADDHPQYSLANGTRWAANQTADRVAISTASGYLSTSSITTTQLGYLSDVTSLIQGQLNNKTDSGHTHSIANINNLQTNLDSRVLNSRVVTTASGLTGGGDLSDDRTIGLNIQALQSKAIPSILDQVLIYDPVSLSHRKTTVSGITNYSGGGGGVTAHSALTGLNVDDHPQYSLADGTRWTVTPTANRVVISTASGVLSSSGISTTQLGYLANVSSDIQLQVDNKPPNSRVVATASGLTGGGNLSDNRTIALNLPGLQIKANPANVDQLLIYGISESAHRITTVSGLTSGLQPLLISEENIKTINNQSVLGSGNLTITGGGGITNSQSIINSLIFG